MKSSLKKVGAFSTLSMLAVGVMSASAMGMGQMMGSNATPDEIATRQGVMFQEEALLIGVSVDEVKAAWADGKNFKTLAKEKGVTEGQLQAQIKAKRDEQMKSTLTALVSKGVITQAQADKRLAYMQTKAATTKTGGKKGGRGGMHEGMKGMMDGLGL